MKILTLNGSWTVNQAGKKDKIKADVPTDVHKALTDAGKIPDRFYRDNELDLKWIGEADWNWIVTKTNGVNPFSSK